MGRGRRSVARQQRARKWRRKPSALRTHEKRKMRRRQKKKKVEKRRGDERHTVARRSWRRRLVNSFSCAARCRRGGGRRPSASAMREEADSRTRVGGADERVYNTRRPPTHRVAVAVAVDAARALYFCPSSAGNFSSSISSSYSAGFVCVLYHSGRILPISCSISV